jgi:hypothetical protein
MATTTRDAELTRAQLIKVVRTGGDIKGIAKMRALAALQTRGRKDVGDVLLEVVADTQEAPRFRHMAVIGLYKMGATRADEALTAASRHADELSAPTIAMALGRVGTADRLPVVEKLEGVAARHAKARAAFGATLLAYRHRLDGHDVRPPTAKALQELGRKRSKPIESAKARTDLAARALDALAEEPLGVELTTERGIRIVCEPNTFVWLWTTDAAAQGFSALADQKGVAGVLFRRRRLENAYSLSAIGLGTPTRAGVRLTVHRADSGTILYSGMVAPDGTLDLHARDQPGLAAVAISARVQAGVAEVRTANSAALVPKARTPKPA